MKSRIDRELDEDIEFLNEAFAQLSAGAVTAHHDIETARRALESIPPSEVEKLDPKAKAALAFARKNLPILSEAYDWRTFTGADVSDRMEEVVSGEFDERAARDLRRARDELLAEQEAVLAAIIQLCQPRVLSPPEFIKVVLDTLPVEARSLRTYFRNLGKFLENVQATTDEKAYHQGVIIWANLFSFIALVLTTLTKWVDYGLDEWNTAYRRGRSPSSQPLRRIERVRGRAHKFLLNGSV